ncbi:MAG: VWA domain-containing protein [Syntrophobacteraceae bacterium]|nr:VWA domain-containing protein [Syntrophobacteraceae bacterium]
MNEAARSESGVVDRFLVQGERGYSAFWRRDKSPIEVIELAKLLGSLRKIGSFIGPNLGTIVWTGMEHKNGLALDPTPVVGVYPVPADRTDIMVGITVRQAFETREWSERLKRIGIEKASPLPPYRYKLKLFLEMCEKVYVDCLANRTFLGVYTEKARLWEYINKAQGFLTPPTFTHVLHLWWRIAADRSGEKYKERFRDITAGNVRGVGDLAKLYGKPIALLNSMVERLIDECPEIPRVTERSEYRLNLYLSVWSELLEYVKFWPGDRSDPFLIQDPDFREVELEDDEKKALQETIYSFARQIESTFRRKVSYSEDVRGNVKNIDDVVQIEKNDLVMDAANRVDKALLQKLKLIIKAASQRKTTYNRGLTSGKIDRRRLYRAPTSGLAFHVKKNEFELLNDIVIVVDASGSMADPEKWEQTETIVQTLFTAVKSFNSTSRMFAYNEVNNKCRLTEIFVRGGFFSVLPHGKTASGEAIIATALSMKVGRKKPFLIHITDGASNWGCGVGDAIAFCKKKRISLLTLGIGCTPSAKQSLTKEYGNLVQYIDKIDELPNVFGSLIRCINWQ